MPDYDRNDRNFMNFKHGFAARSMLGLGNGWDKFRTWFGFWVFRIVLALAAAYLAWRWLYMLIYLFRYSNSYHTMMRDLWDGYTEKGATEARLRYLNDRWYATLEWVILTLPPAVLVLAYLVPAVWKRWEIHWPQGRHFRHDGSEAGWTNWTADLRSREYEDILLESGVSPSDRAASVTEPYNFGDDPDEYAAGLSNGLRDLMALIDVDQTQKDQGPRATMSHVQAAVSDLDDWARALATWREMAAKHNVSAAMLDRAAGGDRAWREIEEIAGAAGGGGDDTEDPDAEILLAAFLPSLVGAAAGRDKAAETLHVALRAKVVSREALADMAVAKHPLVPPMLAAIAADDAPENKEPDERTVILERRGRVTEDMKSSMSLLRVKAGRLRESLRVNRRFQRLNWALGGALVLVGLTLYLKWITPYIARTMELEPAKYTPLAVAARLFSDAKRYWRLIVTNVAYFLIAFVVLVCVASVVVRKFYEHTVYETEVLIDTLDAVTLHLDTVGARVGAKWIRGKQVDDDHYVRAVLELRTDVPVVSSISLGTKPRRYAYIVTIILLMGAGIAALYAVTASVAPRKSVTRMRELAIQTGGAASSEPKFVYPAWFYRFLGVGFLNDGDRIIMDGDIASPVPDDHYLRVAVMGGVIFSCGYYLTYLLPDAWNVVTQKDGRHAKAEVKKRLYNEGVE